VSRSAPRAAVTSPAGAQFPLARRRPGRRLGDRQHDHPHRPARSASGDRFAAWASATR